MQEAIARLENRLLQHNRVEQELLRLIPARELEASPLLLQARCAELVWNGELIQAKTMLSAALKGIAARTLRRPLLSALSQLAVLNLRMGYAHEAKPIIRFLRDEWEPTDEEIGGDVPYALARGLYLLEDAQPDGDDFVTRRQFYRSALAAYDRDGETERAGLALFEMLARERRKLSDASWEEGIVEFRQRVRTGQADEALLLFLYALRSYSQGKRDDKAPRGLAGCETLPLLKPLDKAAHELAGCGPLPLPKPFDEAARVLRFHIAVRNGDAAAMELAATEMEMLQPDLSVDLEWQLEWARVCFERALHRSDRVSAQKYYAQARAIVQIGLPPEAAEALDAMERRLNEAHGNADELTAAAAERSGWQVRLFGQLVFSREGRDVRSIDWKRKKTKELAVYLLLQPNFGAPREQIAEALFGDSEPDKMDNRLYVAAHQLKQVIKTYLNEEGGIVSKDGWIRLKDGLLDTVDTERHSAHLRVGDQLWPADRKLAVGMYRKAEPLYGEIAPDIQYVDWLDRIREHLLERQCEMLRRLGQYAEEQGEQDAAETYYRRRIELTPMREEAYHGLIRMLANQGRLSEAEAVFSRLEKLLQQELGERPMPETRALLRELTQ